MTSKRKFEGYLLIDHTASPGLTPEQAVQADLPASASGSKLFESAVITCSHCQVQVILRPDRTRERGYCKKCDRYICDACVEVLHLTGICFPWVAKEYEALNMADGGKPSAEIIITPGGFING